MSYLVLARKWRPRRFSELVGQEHVVRALTNALQSGRVHHAFLFTGTRGIGKTTIARIFAKSLNCMRGTGAEPCGECDICKAVDEGRFVDLLEIDAASNTGVDDVRELIENAQYRPMLGRYKVYLIDEVHMLSKNAFNALLKTLEEPPEHVKFLLATTDPQRLPATVLSRCLQFNLQRLSQEQIAGQIRHILAAEAVEADAAAIELLAEAADGSLRDGLSVLDQALAFGDGRLLEDDVRKMLGTVERSRIAGLLDALVAGDGAGLMQVAAGIAEFSPDFSGVLDALALALHRVQLCQLVPGTDAGLSGVNVAALASAVGAETVQVWYQMALLGGRDLALAPSAQVGFEMTLLRMLAFAPTIVPAGSNRPANPAQSAAPVATPRPARRAVTAPAAAPGSADRGITDAPPVAQLATPDVVAGAGTASPDLRMVQDAPIAIVDNESWLLALRHSDVSGPARELGANLRFVRCVDEIIEVFLPASHDYLRSPGTVQALCQALGATTTKTVRLAFVAAPQDGPVETLADRTRREALAREQHAREAFANDPVVRSLVAEGATIRAESVRSRRSS